MHLNQEQTFRLEAECERLDYQDMRSMLAASADPRKIKATKMAARQDRKRAMKRQRHD